MKKQPLKLLLQDNEPPIIKSKTHDDQLQKKTTSFYSNISDGKEQLSEGKLYQGDTSYSSGSLHSLKTLIEEYQWQNYQKLIDSESLSEQAKKIFMIQTSSSEEWVANFTEKCVQVECFFKDSTFNTFLETTFHKEDQQLKQTLVLTLDYFTNLITFTFYLLWKAIQNDNQLDMSLYVSNSNSITEFLVLMVSLRVNEFKLDFQLIKIFESIVQPFPDRDLFKDCYDSQKDSLSTDIIQQKIFMPLSKHNQVLPWSTDDVAFILSFINQQFYTDLQLRNIIIKGGLNNYFRRINTISQFIIYSVVRNPSKLDRQDALGYWIDLAEKLQSNYDLEGLFIIYKYGIQLLLKDYIGTMPVLFRDLNRIPKINSFYEQHIKDNFKDIENHNQHYYIPSFHKFITQIKRFELQIKTNKNLFHSISDILLQLIKISKRQHQIYRQTYLKISEKEKQMIYYFQKGIEKELEQDLQIPLDKETLVYIELIKLAKNTH